MNTMVRAIVKLCIVAVVTFLPAASSYAETFVYASATGSDNNPCTAAQACATVRGALVLVSLPPIRLICLNGSVKDQGGVDLGASNISIDIDCPQGLTGHIGVFGANTTLRVQHLGFRNDGNATTEVSFFGSGTLILEDCVFTDAASTTLDIEPNGSLNVVIRNSRISNGTAGGLLLKPQAGGSITATLDHVTIAGNGGGGIKIDTTNGPVSIDIADSVVSKNGGNGINAVGNAGGQAVINIKNSVIAKNGAAGVQANGINAGVLVQTTLFDQNAAGATTVVAGGHISTYGNNSIVGSAGSGFTATAGLQ